MDLEHLKDPFPADCIEWRIGQSGKTRDGRPWAKVLAYLTNRAIMDRLDEVCGPAGWENRFEKAPNDPKGESLLCGIGIEYDGRMIWKWDGASNTEFEAVKGGISDSMKRAAVQWGIGRYLYGIGESWADCTEENMRGQDGWRYAKTKDGTFWWKPPALPGWATPKAEAAEQPVARGRQVARPRAGAAARGVDHKRLVLTTLDEVCGCENDEQRDAVINYVTGGNYTAVGELNDPEDARKVHAAFREFGKKNRLDGLALTEEVGSAFGF
jgi:hypothetical protein